MTPAIVKFMYTFHIHSNQQKDQRRKKKLRFLVGGVVVVVSGRFLHFSIHSIQWQFSMQMDTITQRPVLFLSHELRENDENELEEVARCNLAQQHENISKIQNRCLRRQTIPTTTAITATKYTHYAHTHTHNTKYNLRLNIDGISLPLDKCEISTIWCVALDVVVSSHVHQQWQYGYKKIIFSQR